jgi:hypothetical protein
MSAAKHTPKTTAAESAGIAFAQLKANGKLVLDEDGKRWAADVETAIGEAEDETNALADGLVDAAKRCASLHGALFGKHECPTCIPWLAALRTAGRLP